METIYLLLTRTDTTLSKAIATVTKDPYTHAAISLDREFNELYSFGRKSKNNPLNAGFVREQRENSIYEKNLHCNCALYEIDISDKQFQRLRAELEEMRSMQDLYSYNFLGLFNFIFGIRVKRSYKFFCSEFVSEMLKRIEVLPKDHTPELTKPSDFTKMDGFKNIYKGRLGTLLMTGVST